MNRRDERRARELDHYPAKPSVESQVAFPGSLFDQAALDAQPQNGNNERQLQRAGLPREHGMIPPASSKSITSQKSADRLMPRFGSKLRKVYDHIDAAGATGCTRQEIADETGMLLQSVCSAVNRLYQMGEKGIGAGIGSNPNHERDGREVLVAARYVERWKVRS